MDDRSSVLSGLDQGPGAPPAPGPAPAPGWRGIRGLLTARHLFLLVAVAMSAQLVYYFYTGAGGAVQLATRLLPAAVVLWALRAYEGGGPYKRLPRRVNLAVTAGFVAASAVVFTYFLFEYEDIFLIRTGSYNTADLVVGSLILLIIMEISRQLHPVLFGVNLVLIVYSLFGQYSAIDFFWHPGTSVKRLITSSTVELQTGVYGRYTQMALTLIAAFLLLAAVARGFTAQAAVLRWAQRLFSRSRRSIPFTAVVSSASIGLVSGSGAANSAVVGSFTIPLMKRHGLPGARAGAVETAASMGGLILPPLMAVAGFIMAEFLGVPYWDVAMRGFAIGFIYFASLMLAVYLVTVRSIPAGAVERPRLHLFEYLKTGLFFGAVAALIVMLGVLHMGELRSALYAATLLLVALLIVYIVFKYLRREEEYRTQRLLANLRTTVETFADLAWYLVILMATLGIMIGLFTVTGFLLRMGSLLLDLTEWSIVATILLAWVFGWLAGTGLPPTATYVVVAVVIVPPLVQWGVDPWVAHFFAFLLAVWGELSPPTSLTAAVCASIAGASFMRTMYEALRICMPIVLVTFAIFVRSDAVTTQGWGQIPDTLLLTVGTMAVAFAMLGRFVADRRWDTAARVGLVVLAAAVLFHPSAMVATGAAVAAVALLVVGVYRIRRSTGPETPGVAAAGAAA